MERFDTQKSEDLLARAREVIPGGVFGHYGTSVRRPGPKWFSRSDGAYFWDIDDNKYIDYMCAYGPMILGYNHPVVDEAARNQYQAGNTVSVSSPVMVELAELLVETVDAADWALFGKNGGDSTSLAVRIARAATGRTKIVKIQDGYHGVAPWMMASMATEEREIKGITKEDGANLLQIPWNDPTAFEQLIAEYPDDIACFISSPYDHPAMRDNTLPEDGYWAKVESLCQKHGILLIVDDVRSGFRIDLAGSNVAYGFSADMVCFGKAIANGYPLSALVGRDSLKKVASEVFYTGSHFFQAAPMAAAKACLVEMKKADAANQMTQFGNKLNDGLVNIASQHGYDLKASGIPAMPYYRLTNVPFDIHSQWIDECVTRGVYLLNYHNHFVSTAHDEDDLNRTFDIVNEAFKALGDSAQHQVA